MNRVNQDVINDAIANISSTSKELEKFCNDPESKCSPFAANLLEQMSWELHKQASDLREINYLYIS